MHGRACCCRGRCHDAAAAAAAAAIITLVLAIDCAGRVDTIIKGGNVRRRGWVRRGGVGVVFRVGVDFWQGDGFAGGVDCGFCRGACLLVL